jgi:hypothetical protein
MTLITCCAGAVEQLCGAANMLSVLCSARAAQSADLATQITILLLQTLHDDLADDGYVEQHSAMQAIIEVHHLPWLLGQRCKIAHKQRCAYYALYQDNLHAPPTSALKLLISSRTMHQARAPRLAAGTVPKAGSGSSSVLHSGRMGTSAPVPSFWRRASSQAYAQAA